jgi:hypothetical protein
VPVAEPVVERSSAVGEAARSECGWREQDGGRNGEDGFEGENRMQIIRWIGMKKKIWKDGEK